MSDRYVTVKIRCLCRHTRTERFKRRILRLGRKKHGPKFLHRQVRFFELNKCRACFDDLRPRALFGAEPTP